MTQRRVRTTIRPDDVLTVEDGDFASLKAQSLILEVLDDEAEEAGGHSVTPQEPPVEVPTQQAAKGRGKTGEASDGW